MKTVTFLIVLRNQFHSIFTWKDIRSLSILWFGLTLKCPNSLWLKIAKSVLNLNTECVTNIIFGKLVVIMIHSKKLGNIILTNFIAPCVQMLQWEFVKNILKLKIASLWKGQGCGNEVLESGIYIKSLENGLSQLSLCSSKACKSMAYLFRRKCYEIKRTVTFKWLVD